MNLIILFSTFTTVTSFVNILNRFVYGNDVSALTSSILNYPKLDYHMLTPQDHFDLQWYVIGTKSDFLVNKPVKATIWNKNYVVWRTMNDTYVGLDDACTHKGAALSKGKICNNNVVCPYHGYEFDADGILTKVPGICFRPSPIYDLPKYQVVEKNGWVYLNTHYNKTDSPQMNMK